MAAAVVTEAVAVSAAAASVYTPICLCEVVAPLTVVVMTMQRSAKPKAFE